MLNIIIYLYIFNQIGDQIGNSSIEMITAVKGKTPQPQQNNLGIYIYIYVYIYIMNIYMYTKYIYI
jgi:hypothetical protein